MKFEFELLRNNRYSVISRATVHGGWIVNSLTESPTNALSEAMVFVPDPEHLWEIDGE